MVGCAAGPRRPVAVVLVFVTSVVRRDADQFVGGHITSPTLPKCMMLQSFSCPPAITRKENRASNGKGQFIFVLFLVVDKGCLALLHSWWLLGRYKSDSPTSAEPHTALLMQRASVSCLEGVMHGRLLNGGFFEFMVHRVFLWLPPPCHLLITNSCSRGQALETWELWE